MPRTANTSKQPTRTLKDWLAVSDAILAAADAEPTAGPVGGVTIRSQVVLAPEMVEAIDKLYALAHSDQIVAEASPAPAPKPGPKPKPKAKTAAAPAAPKRAARKPAKRLRRAPYGHNRQVVRQAVDALFATGKTQITRQEIIAQSRLNDPKIDGSQVAVALTHWTAGPKPYLVRPGAGLYRRA